MTIKITITIKPGSWLYSIPIGFFIRFYSVSFGFPDTPRFSSGNVRFLREGMRRRGLAPGAERRKCVGLLAVKLVSGCKCACYKNYIWKFVPVLYQFCTGLTLTPDLLGRAAIMRPGAVETVPVFGMLVSGSYQPCGRGKAVPTVISIAHRCI